MEISTIKKNYKTEIALVILCCRQYIQTTDNNSIQVFLQQNKIDWKLVYKLSKAHRVRPVCYKVLLIFKEIIGVENLEEFRNYCVYFNAFDLNNKRELNRIIGFLKKNNIAANPFKGIDFAESFYGDTGLREFSDNDIIINEKDIRYIIKIMVNEGYQSEDIKFYNKFPSQYIRDYKDLFFEKTNKSFREFAFEFHFKTTRFFQGYALSFSEILGKDYLSESRKYNAIDYLKLITLSNGITDFYPDLRSILDVAVIYKKANGITINTIDPFIKRYLDYGVIISNELLDYPIVPADIKIDIKAIKFSGKLLENLLNLNEGKRLPLLKYMYFNIKQTNSKYKLQQLKNYILLIIRPNLNDITSLNLPDYRLYYFTKPFRILIKKFIGLFYKNN